MPTMRALLVAPVALAYWRGAAGRNAGEEGDDLIFVYHGTLRDAAAELDRQLCYLRRKFQIVPLVSLAVSTPERRPPGSLRRAAITFDDGLRSNVCVAYPILRKRRVLYRDLTGQAVPPATAVEGRKWIVENQDIDSCYKYWRDGKLDFADWLASFRGVREGAWFAWDDLWPFCLMCRSFLAACARSAVRKLVLPRRGAATS